jgi:hypothetical protein
VQLFLRLLSLNHLMDFWQGATLLLLWWCVRIWCAPISWVPLYEIDLVAPTQIVPIAFNSNYIANWSAQCLKERKKHHKIISFQPLCILFGIYWRLEADVSSTTRNFAG